MIHCSPPHSIPREQTPTEYLPLYVCPFVVLQDTREQQPWAFQNIVIQKRLWVIRRQLATLATCDYSIEGMEGRVLVERKSAADFTGSVTGGASRFKREHERMADVVSAGGFCCVVVEGCLSTICREIDEESGRRINSDHIIGACASWPARYGVPWFFAGTRRLAEVLAFRILLKRWMELGK